MVLSFGEGGELNRRPERSEVALDRLLRQRRDGNRAAGRRGCRRRGRGGRRRGKLADIGRPGCRGCRRRLLGFLGRGRRCLGRRLGVQLLHAGAARGAAFQFLAVGGRAGLGLGGRRRGRRRGGVFLLGERGGGKGDRSQGRHAGDQQTHRTSPGPLAEGDGAAST